MASVTTTKPVNLYQLTQEIGGSPSFRCRGELASTDEKIIESDTDQTTLESAVGAHVADPTIQPPPDPGLANASAIDQAITNALAELRTMRDYPALPVVPSGTHTTAQLSNYMRALRDEAQTNRQGIQRVCSTLIGTIRLLRGDFDDID